MRAYPKTLRFKITAIVSGKTEQDKIIVKNKKEEFQARTIDLAPNFTVEFLN